MVVSGSCIGAHNTAVYWALHLLGGAYLTDGHGFGTSLHAVHFTGGRYRRHGRPQKDLKMGLHGRFFGNGRPDPACLRVIGPRLPFGIVADEVV